MQAAGIAEVRARAAKLRRAGVHHVDEGLVVTGNVAGQDVGALVARRQEQAGEEVLHREGLPGAKAGVGAVGGNHVKVGLLDRDLVGQAGVLEHQERRHDLGHGRRIVALVGVLVQKDVAGRAVKEEGRLRGELGLLVRRIGRGLRRGLVRQGGRRGKRRRRHEKRREQRRDGSYQTFVAEPHICDLPDCLHRERLV